MLDPGGIKPRCVDAGGYAKMDDGSDPRKSNFWPFKPEQPIKLPELQVLIERIQMVKKENASKEKKEFKVERGERVRRTLAIELLWREVYADWE